MPAEPINEEDPTSSRICRCAGSADSRAVGEAARRTADGELN